MADSTLDAKERTMTAKKLTIPVIDIEPWTKLYAHEEQGTSIPDGNEEEQARQSVVQAVATACREVGFFAIRNHGVDLSIVEAAQSASMAFFDMREDKKLAVSFSNQVLDYPYGYENSEVLSHGKQTETKAQDGSAGTRQTSPDLKETFSIGPYNPEAGMPSRRFPKEPVELEPALTSYYLAMERLALQLLHIFAVALDLPNPATWFADKMDHHLSALRILNYFPVKQSQIEPGQLRASAHTDYGTLTILKSDGPGLQVKKDLDSEDWVDVPYLNDAFIINLGDLMRRWTNGTLM